MKINTSAAIFLRVGFILVAAPAITTAPRYRPSAPMSSGDIVLVLVGCGAIVAFGAVLMLMWNRFNAPTQK